MTLDTEEERNFAVDSRGRGTYYPVWCLALAWVRVYDVRLKKNQDAGRAVQGLLLLRNSMPNHFRRIGKFCSNVGQEPMFLNIPNRMFFYIE